jgi:probable F420-dependent oxidoreductase
MKLSLAPWGESLAELRAAAVAAEDAGFDTVWLSELHRSAFVPAAVLVEATRRVRVGTAIALAFVRSPLTTALTSLDLDELSDGRFVLGLGSGVKRLNEDWHNAAFGKPASHLRESITAIRTLMASVHTGETIRLEGEWEPVHLRGYERPFPPRRTDVPIFVASVGEVMTRLAGEVGDGWIAHELGSPAYLTDVVTPNLEAGMARRGRQRDQLEVVASACCVIDDDARQAKRAAAGLVAFYASVKTYDDFFDFHGFLAEAKAVQQRFRAGDHEHLADAIPDEMVDALTMAGTPDDVRKWVRRYDGIADQIKLSPPTHFVPAEVTRSAQQRILEVLSP